MTTEDLLVHIEGIGWHSPGIPDWKGAIDALRGGAALPESGATRPAAAALPAQERRRAPDSVLLACDVAGQACAMAGRDAGNLPTVFVSAHGDIAISEALCSTLADDPLALSPTRFHNSVHNAPVGYWTVAAHCHAASSAVSAWRGSFAAGLLEASVQALAENTPVLFAAYDVAAQGPLGEVLQAAIPFGVALLLNPERAPHAVASLRVRHEARGAAPETPTAFAETTPVAGALPLFALLARAREGRVHLPNGSAGTLAIEVAA